MLSTIVSSNFQISWTLCLCSTHGRHFER